MRHSIFVIGNAGTGKSKILRSLNKTYANMKLKPVWVDLNPKAVTTDELFGFINPATREWKDGKTNLIDYTCVCVCVCVCVCMHEYMCMCETQ